MHYLSRPAERAVNYPVAESAGRLKIVHLFSTSFPLVRNYSDVLGIAKKILDKPE